MSYASIQAIREGAGLLLRVNNEKSRSVSDGTNLDFVVARRPIVGQANSEDGEVSINDVQVYVAGVNVEVTAVDADSGSITLAEAPVSGASVTVDYSHSPITDDYVGGKQQEADSWVDLKIKAYIKTPLDPVPGIIATAAEMYAAGLILTRDWGSRVDTEQTSKDGFAKIKQARDLIADYIQGLKDDKTTTSQTSGDDGAVSVATDCDVFSREEQELGHQFGGNTDDEYFMRRQ